MSFSALADYARCAEHYRRKRIEREDDPTSLPAVVGTSFHSAVETYEGLELDELRAEELHRLAGNLLDAEPGVRSLRFFGKQDVDWWIHDGMGALAEKYVAHRVAERANGFRWFADNPIAASEIKLSVQLADDLPLLVGYVDQAHYDSQGLLALRDLKTGEPKEAHAIQGGLYVVAWNELHPEAPAAYSSMLYLKGKAAKQVPVVPSLDRAGLEWLLRGFVRAVEAGVFPATGAFQEGVCRMCVFRGDCPAGIAVHGANSLV